MEIRYTHAKVKFLRLILFLVVFLSFFDLIAQASVIKDRTEFLKYAGTVTTESFEGMTPVTGATVLTQIPASDINDNFQMDRGGSGLMQVWNTTTDPSLDAADGDQAIFFSAGALSTEENPSSFRFSNFQGSSAQINTFGFYLVDWNNSVTQGALSFKTDTGVTGILEEVVQSLPNNVVRYFGIITTEPFSEITIYTTIPGDWTLIDAVSYGIEGLHPPKASDDMAIKVPSTFICEGNKKGFPVDLDGVNNGTSNDPNETLFVIETLNGKIGGDKVVQDKVLFYSFLNNNCSNPTCTNCPSGKFLFRFVDMTAFGFDINNSDTWVYKTIPKISLRARNNQDPRPNTTKPYSVVKAYKETNNATPGNLIDINPSIEVTGNGGYTQCAFEDLDDGIGEVYIQTDFAENIMNDIILYSNPVNTPLGASVEVSSNNGTLKFDQINGTGTTTVTKQKNGPGFGGNFSICDPNEFYNITTTANFSGNIEVCLEYNESCESSDLQLLHFENGQWIDVTTSIDTDNNIICGVVNSLSPFAIVTSSKPFNFWYAFLLGLILLVIILLILKNRNKD
ncbi:hypothetical protein U6A24_13330 [Aquimarina gracilis]|uniref:Secreted protein (IPTL-CTERM system target) n=1 Tax=Aquimarina gracilis TaxID=874422 RepID=A0ABU5ZX86_9FLAO|nr:hypothetical protein [Aquimarina gracilis]MEB3346453.1 hypothetical protein [Aquimarina gracilis]